MTRDNHSIRRPAHREELEDNLSDTVVVDGDVEVDAWTLHSRCSL